jgi:D-xylose transport system permease protein
MATTEQPQVPAEEEKPVGVPVPAEAPGGNPLVAMFDPRGWMSAGGGRTIPLLIAMVVMWIAFDITTNGVYFGSQNITNILVYASIYGIIAIGVVIVLLLGEIDLSLGSLVGLCGCTAALVMVQWVPNASDLQKMLVGVAASVIVGLLCGIFTGFWVAVMKIPSFVVTLAGLLAFNGIALVITNSNTVVISSDDFNAFGASSVSAFNRGFLPMLVGHGDQVVHLSVGILGVVILGAGYCLVLLSGRRSRQKAGLPSRSVASLLLQGVAITIGAVAVVDVLDRYQGVPLPVAIFMLLLIIFAYVTRRTRYGRHVYATGGNPEASRRSGIAIQRIRWSAFVLSGLMAGMVGVIFMARGNSASAGSVDQSFLLLCIASAVIGGTSLFGGRGSVWSALTGALILASVQTGMNLTLTSTNATYYQYIVEGAILLGAVWLDTYAKNKSTVDRAA